MSNERKLRQAGRLLYGRQWKSELAERLGVTVRTVHLWSVKAPADEHAAWARIASLLEDRAESIARHLRAA